MRNRIGIILLVLICVVLGVALIWSSKEASTRRDKDIEEIGYHSNRSVSVQAKLDEQIQVSLGFSNDVVAARKEASTLTNRLAQVSKTLADTQQEMKDEIARRDAKITELEKENQELDAQALNLGNSITNLTAQIDDTERKLAASEGDKAFLEKELQRLMEEKATLERQFNDLTVLRAQVSKLKEELNVARRLAWIRQGLFARSEQKGAEQLMQRPATPAAGAAAAPQRSTNYDLNVEVGSDGSLKVIPPLVNGSGPTNAPQ